MGMKKVFLVHGYKGEPNGGWRPYLMGKLAQADVWAYALAMPTPDSPQKDEWVEAIARAIGEPDENTYIVGHSLGVPSILHYLESIPEGKKIGGAVLVSGPIRVLEGDKYRPIDSFMNTEFEYDHIKKVCAHFAVIHGDNDEGVPFAHAEELAHKLDCKLIPIPNGGHLNGASGWYELPEAFDALMGMIQV